MCFDSCRQSFVREMPDSSDRGHLILEGFPSISVVSTALRHEFGLGEKTVNPSTNISTIIITVSQDRDFMFFNPRGLKCDSPVDS